MKTIKKNIKKMNCTSFFATEDDYDNFVLMAQAFDEEGTLPMVVEHNAPHELNLDGFQQFSVMFREDTGLDVSLQLYTCEHCDRLHYILAVDAPDEDEDWR